MGVNINNFVLENPKIIKDSTLMVISDIHKNLKMLPIILELIKHYKPDYLCIVGDLSDMTNCDASDILMWLEAVTSYVKGVIICKGNHDELSLINGKWQCAKNDEFFTKVNEISGCHFLTEPFNQLLLQSDGLSFNAINMPSDWYENKKERKQEFDELMKSISVNNFSSEYFNILLSHTPRWFIKEGNLVTSETYQIMQKINLILCGHYHGGLTPHFIRQFMNGTGITGPYNEYLLKNAYGNWSNDECSLILSDGITKLAKSNGFISNFNRFYRPDIEIIDLHPGKNHQLVRIKEQ